MAYLVDPFHPLPAESGQRLGFMTYAGRTTCRKPRREVRTCVWRQGLLDTGRSFSLKLASPLWLRNESAPRPVLLCSPPEGPRRRGMQLKCTSESTDCPPIHLILTCLFVQELTQGLPASATKRLAPRFRQIKGGARGFLQTHDQGTLDTISLQLRNTRAYMRKLAALTIGT